MAGEAGKKLILVVEDEADERSYLTTLFEDNGYRVVAAENGEEALDTARREKPDLVSLDLTMPKVGGLEVLRRRAGMLRHPGPEVHEVLLHGLPVVAFGPLGIAGGVLRCRARAPGIPHGPTPFPLRGWR